MGFLRLACERKAADSCLSPWHYLEVHVITGVISRVTILITHIRVLITPLITTHEPPSITEA